MIWHWLMKKCVRIGYVIHIGSVSAMCPMKELSENETDSIDMTPALLQRLWVLNLRWFGCVYIHSMRCELYGVSSRYSYTRSGAYLHSEYVAITAHNSKR